MKRLTLRSMAFGVIAAAAGLVGCQQSKQEMAPKSAPGQLPSLTQQVDAKMAPADTPKINAATFFAHAHLLERQGAFAQAAEQYATVLEMQPDFLTARNRLGVTLNKLGRNGEATQQFRLCVAAQPNTAYLHNNLGFSLFLEGRYDEADAAFRKALELKPEFARVHMNLAVNFARRGLFDQAYEEFAKVCSQADAMYNIGILLTEAGRYSDAAQYLEGALAANPQHEAARQQLTELARLAADASQNPTAAPQPMLTTIEPPKTPPSVGAYTQIALANDEQQSDATHGAELILPPTIPVKVESPGNQQPTPAPAPNPGSGEPSP
ncbi:MAG: tetratricopeptide repeat protein [Planctomycetes bacterium]|nr:tetratricopeptide repeat protein [Planctomycetota bacterium]